MIKDYLTELLICTIVAVVVTLLSYVIGTEQSWQSAANTFGVAFLTMFVVGLYSKSKQKRKNNNQEE